MSGRCSVAGGHACCSLFGLGAALIIISSLPSCHAVQSPSKSWIQTTTESCPTRSLQARFNPLLHLLWYVRPAFVCVASEAVSCGDGRLPNRRMCFETAPSHHFHVVLPLHQAIGEESDPQGDVALLAGSPTLAVLLRCVCSPLFFGPLCSLLTRSGTLCLLGCACVHTSQTQTSQMQLCVSWQSSVSSVVPMPKQ